MSRTTRRPNLGSWQSTKSEAWDYYQKTMEWWGPEHKRTRQAYRNWFLCGTDSQKWKFHNHWFFNQAHRKGRRTARDQLRPQMVMSEDYDFDPSKYDAKWKGVWWDIF
jgi:hypothetical protein